LAWPVLAVLALQCSRATQSGSKRMKPIKLVWLVATAAAAFFSGTRAEATIVVNPPGFVDSLVAPLPTAVSNFYGNIEIDASGNRYVSGGLTGDVYRISAAGSVSI